MLNFIKSKKCWIGWIVWWFIIAVLIVSTLWCSLESLEERIKAIVSSISAFAVSTTLLINSYYIFARSEERKFELTFQIIRKWDDEHFMQARDYTRQQQDIGEDKGQKEILESINKDSELKRSIILMLNYFEVIESVLRKNMADEDIIMRHFAHMINDILKRYDCFVNCNKEKNPLGNKLLQNLKSRTENYVMN